MSEQQHNSELTEELREKIHNGGWRSQSDKQLLQWLKTGQILFSRLVCDSTSSKTIQRDTDRLNRLKKDLATEEISQWNTTVASDCVDDYITYLNCYGENATYAKEAHEALVRKDKEMWQSLTENPSKEGIEDYRRTFPNGLFTQDCVEMEQDLPWRIAKKKNTIEALLEYQKCNPGKHGKEIEELIETIKDNTAWKIAETNKSTGAYIQYIDERAGLGKKYKDFDDILGDFISYIRTESPKKLCNHYNEARKKIENRGGKEILLDELRKDPNCYGVVDLRNEIASIADMQLDDLKEIFTDAQVKAIRDYTEPQQLDMVEDPNELRRGYTEVYFWGLRKTGKTCAIGATIGYLSNVKKSLNPEPCPGQKYLLQLQNLFCKGGKICTLPLGTPTGNLPAMTFTFDDNKGCEHRVTFIDVAGEVFSAIYAQQNGLSLQDKDKKAIEALENRLKNSYNNKIHFFIIEYGDDNGEVAVRENLYASKSQVMQALAIYFDKQKIFNDSSVSMNLLVTKCDKIRKGDRMEEVKHYVDESGWAAAANGINKVSCDSRGGRLCGIGFSIGEVFAQDLCVFCPDDAEGIVEEIEKYTHPFKRNWWGKLLDSIRK